MSSLPQPEIDYSRTDRKPGERPAPWIKLYPALVAVLKSERLACLIQLIQYRASRRESGKWPASQQQIANLLFISEDQASYALRGLRDRGLIQIERARDRTQVYSVNTLRVSELRSDARHIFEERGWELQEKDWPKWAAPRLRPTDPAP